MASTAHSSSSPRRRPLKTALHQAVLDGRLHQVRLLVAKHNSSVDSRDVNGRTPLMLACILDSEDYGYKMAKIFITSGTYLNIRDNMGRTALSYACMNGCEKIVKLILKEDVLDLNDPDNDGFTPLHHATVSGNPNVVEVVTEVIVRFGLNIDVRNCMGYTALLLACKLGHYASAYILYTTGQASAALRDNEFFLTAIEWARRGKDFHPRLGKVETPKVSRAPTFFSISREKTMYHRALTPICRHARARPNALTSSCGSFTQFPVVFKISSIGGGESMIQGKNARQLLMATMEDVPVSAKRPFSTRRNIPRFPPPTSAKLREITQFPLSKPTDSGIKRLFKIYSDQYGYNMQLRALATDHFARLDTKDGCSTRETTTPSVAGDNIEVPVILVNS